MNGTGLKSSFRYEKFAEYQSARQRLEDAKAEASRADTALRNATNILGKALCPPGVKSKEDFGTWIGDVYVTISRDQESYEVKEVKPETSK